MSQFCLHLRLPVSRRNPFYKVPQRSIIPTVGLRVQTGPSTHEHLEMRCIFGSFLMVRLQFSAAFPMQCLVPAVHFFVLLSVDPCGSQPACQYHYLLLDMQRPCVWGPLVARAMCHHSRPKFYLLPRLFSNNNNYYYCYKTLRFFFSLLATRSSTRLGAIGASLSPCARN